jgi:acyl-CoA synthetase (AMP-forming)/AMP-acid ligase II
MLRFRFPTCLQEDFPMLGQMQDHPLLISTLIDHAAKNHPEGEIVSRRVEGDLHRTNYGQVARRSKQVAGALDRLGLAFSDRVATLAWNGYRHLELYYAVSGSQLVLHTINPRLHPEQIAWIANHATDQVLCFDPPSCRWSKLDRRAMSTVKAFRGDDRPRTCRPSRIPNLLCYEDLLEAENGDWATGRVRRKHRFHAVLHLRHHRQPQGRRCTATARRCCTPMRPRCRMRWAAPRPT